MRITFTGPESSGKTTLAKTLASRLQYTYIPEFAREYLTGRPEGYDHHDFIHIAQKQYDRIQSSKKSVQPVILDTDLTVLTIWEAVKFGKKTKWLEQAWNQENYDFIFLCKPDFPWEYDPLRENPQNQNELFDLYIDQLFLRGHPFYTVSGPLESRLEKILNVIGTTPNQIIGD